MKRSQEWEREGIVGSFASLVSMSDLYFSRLPPSHDISYLGGGRGETLWSEHSVPVCQPGRAVWGDWGDRDTPGGVPV